MQQAAALLGSSAHKQRKRASDMRKIQDEAKRRAGRNWWREACEQRLSPLILSRLQFPFPLLWTSDG
eukprot:2316967-Rhodomonas_salina.4